MDWEFVKPSQMESATNARYGSLPDGFLIVTPSSHQPFQLDSPKPKACAPRVPVSNSIASFIGEDVPDFRETFLTGKPGLPVCSS